MQTANLSGVYPEFVTAFRSTFHCFSSVRMQGLRCLLLDGLPPSSCSRALVQLELIGSAACVPEWLQEPRPGDVRLIQLSLMSRKHLGVLPVVAHFSFLIY